jgi:hypothetical protein
MNMGDMLECWINGLMFMLSNFSIGTLPYKHPKTENNLQNTLVFVGVLIIYKVT